MKTNSDDNKLEIETSINDVEKKLIVIWQDVFKADEVTIKDNLFELGGNSLKVAALVLRIHIEMEVEIPLSEIFHLTTIEQQAEYITMASKSKYISIMPIKEQDYYATSSAQKRMYLLNKLEAESTTYNIPNVYAIKGEIDKKKLEYTFNKIVERHDSLRTFFEVVNGEIVQRIHKDTNFVMEFKELEDTQRSEEIIQEYISEFIRPFELSQYPLIRVCLVSIHEGEHILIIDMHHIIADGTSMKILLREITDIYEEKCLDALKIQYKDFAEWQNKLFLNGFIKRQETYWLETFAKESPLLNMPVDFKRPAIKSFEGNRIDFRIDCELSEGIKEIAKNTNSTIYMVLLAALNVILYRYTGQEDIVVGSPISGRTHEDVEDIIGMFVNTLAMRNYPAGSKTFKNFLIELKENTLRAYENQDYQFEELLSKLDVKRDVSRNPLFDVMFVMRNLETNHIGLQGCEIKPYDFESKIAKFDITLIVVENVDDMYFIIEYCTELFQKETIERLGEHFTNLLWAIIKNIDTRLSELDILSEKERERLLLNFNKTQVEYPTDKTIHELFEEQVKRNPDHIAAVFGEQQYTYSELNKKANSLANVLCANGVGPNVIVGIMVERSLEMLTGILGILKAGGAYLPIDPNYPIDRVKFMIKDSKINLLLIKGKLEHDINRNINTINLEEEDLFSKELDNVVNRTHPNDLAYIIYTSGTTGRPKGVLVKNVGIVSLSLFFKEIIKVTDQDRIIQFANISFDASVWEIFMALLTGAQLHILKKDVMNDYSQFTNYLNQKSITIATLPPPYLININPNSVKSLKTLITAGSQISTDLYQKWKSHISYINAYGPTEATICATIWSYKNNDNNSMESITSIPIGKPIYNTKIYIIDKYNHIQPIGVAGELCISGVGLAKGYLNRPELTADKFIKNPFVDSCDDNNYQRMYRTGDLVRWLPDGNIEFLGRIDQQVKIRGFRIELGEIETVLLKYASIKAVAVIDKKDQEKNKYLCAYFVADQEIPVSKLREHLGKDLPDYMMPQYFIQISQIPLSNSGKVYKKFLPEPDGTIYTGVEYEAAENDIEKNLVTIWQEILNAKRIGVNDNFFHIGGHSLKAVSLVSEIHMEMDVEIPLSKIFHLTTIKKQAEYISRATKSKYVSIEPVKEREYYFASSAQKRMYLLNKLDGVSITYNVSVVYNIKGIIDREKLENTFQEIVKRHDSFRTSFDVVNGEIVQRIHKDANFKIEIKDLKDFAISEETLQGYIREFVRPFNLSEYPLVRACLVNKQDQEHILMLDMHHIITDGASMGILLNEIADIYEGKSLASLRVQYKDFSEWQNKLFKNELIKKQKSYWLEVFSGETPLLNMPVDYKRPAIKSSEGDRIDFEIDRDMTKELKKIAENTNSTIYMVLLAAYNVLLYKYTGQEDIVVGSPISGRTHTEIQNVLGMFVNTLALRNYPKGRKTFEEFLIEVRENAVNAFENQDVQFEELIEKLDIKRDRSRNPLFDTMFVMQNTDNMVMEIEGLKISSYGMENKVSKFDIALNAEEKEGSIWFALNYCTKLFKKETMERFAGHFKNILNETIGDLKVKLSEIEMLSEEESRQILYDFNDTETEYPRDKTIHKLFEEQVERTPDSIAVIFEDESITYGELNREANQVANYLKGQGIGGQKLVGVMVRRNINTIVNIIGILKAEGAYVPIDPEYPQDRRGYIIKNSNLDIVLDEELNEKIENCPDNNNENSSSSSDIAYVIYTSGSTGRPKGVVISHRSAVNTIVDINNRFKVCKEDRIIGLSSMCFDLSVYDIFGALISGATLVMIPDLRDVKHILDVLIKNRITIWNSVPAVMDMIIEYIDDKFSNGYENRLRLVLLSGDWIPVVLPDKIRDRFTDSQVISLGGATEASIWSIYYPIREVKDEWKSIPYGMPLANQTYYVLNKHLKLCPIGVEGELYIGGEGVAQGYQNDEEKTRYAFINHPNLGYLYRTGDYGVMRNEGYIEFIGRKDQQVKIRGYRIELGEIEACLVKHSAVKGVVAVDYTQANGERYLCAYVVLNEEVNLDVLKEFMINSVPYYMVPSCIIKLDKMPLTNNGKIDKKALPEPDGMIYTGVAYEAPTNDIEKKLVAIWQEILSINKVGINDKFFHIGGHSLKAVSLVSKIHKEMSVEIPLSEIFHLTTIKKQAEYISKATKSKYVSIEPVKEREYYLVSSAQKRMYLLNQLDKENTTYNIPCVYKIKGNINKEKLKHIFKEIVRRHDSFRTSFEVVDEDIVQRIHKDANFKMEFKELEDTQRSGEILQEYICEFIRPFDLSGYPLARACLVNNQEEHILMLDMHHIIADGESMRILLNEIKAIYEGKSLAALRIQYKDFSQWQNEIFKNGLIKKQESYWLEVFKGETPLLNIPVDFRRPAIKSSEGGRIGFVINRELTQDLKKIAESTNATMYMVLLAAYNVLLYKYTGQEDIVVGSPISGRTHEDIQDIIGMFVNTLAMRNYPEGRKTFKEFLIELKENALNAYENQDYQFEELLSRLELKRDVSRNPLFDVMFVMKNLETKHIGFKEFDIEPYSSESKISKFDLTLIAGEESDELHCIIEYCTKLFKKETIERLKVHLKNLLERIVENVDTSLSELDILGEEEKIKLLYEFNKKQEEKPIFTSMHELFEDQVKRTPDQIAVVIGEQQVTYSELNQKANSLAKFLRDKGVGSNVIVGIMVERSLEMIIGIIGTLKAGGAYLPIDPNYPIDRVDFMIQDSKINSLLIKGQFIGKLSDDIPTINLENKDLYNKSSDNLLSRNSPDDLAYIIYTSGTTGRPKGVLIRHRSLSNTIQWRKKEYGFSSKDTILQLFSFCFDGFVTSFYSPLISGATNVFVDDDDLKDPKIIVNDLIRYHITHFITIPSLYSVILENIENQELLSLRSITLAGERLTRNIVSISKRKCPNTEIVNEYGPTENCVVTTVFRHIEENKINPIGKPIQNSKVYIIDKYSHLQPIGVAGELCVSGIGLAKGYLNRPELTMEKFVDNPYASSDDPIYKQMYHTGDLARWLPDGNIEFLGRIDQQVKIRGFRIELGEIESVLVRYEGINEAIVIDKKDRKGNKYLCAYFVSDYDIPSSKLRYHLRKELPDYMMPQYFIHIYQIPLSSNGKMDRKALPEPGGLIYTGVEYEAPANDIEKEMVFIWKEVLCIKKVGVNESFFEVGGNSLSIVQVHKYIEMRYPGVIKVTDLFTYHSIKGLATFIQEKCSNQVNKDIATVMFPVKYLDRNALHFSYMTYSFSMDHEIIRKIKLVVKKENVELSDVFLGIFMYLLADITDQEKIGINVLLNTNSFFATIHVDFRNIDSIEELIGFINQYNYEFQSLAELRDIKTVESFDDTYFPVIPLFVKKVGNKEELMEHFHMIVEFESSEDEIKMRCNISRKILKVESDRIVNKYLKLIETYALDYKDL
ncbi:non-ribosomal peptide synthetase [Clostridium sp. E02]|uniref:non-ribosomal peptide synthetase n=1 Tax=Clostridium sp. E02 TaxID=2487134 RepID=UPI0013DE4F80|nr:non-ribosomal peptide synthetase [Clostridium sp. E02]